MMRLAGRAVLALVIVAACGRAASAQGPMAEAGLVLEQTDMGATGDASEVGVEGYYTFSGLSAVDGPLNEALFLSPTPYAGARISGVSGEMFGSDFDGNNIVILGGYADPGMPLAIDLRYGMMGLDMTGGSMDINTLEFSAGYFVMPGMLVALLYDDTVMTSSPGSFETSTTGIGLGWKWVKSLQGGQAFNAEFKYETLTMGSTGSPDEAGSLLAIGGDFYISPTIGFGVLITKDENDDVANAGGQAFEIRASVFVTPQIGLRVSHETYTPEATGADDQTTFKFGAFGRF